MREFLVIEETDQSAKVFSIRAKGTWGKVDDIVVWRTLREGGSGSRAGASMQTCFLTCNNEHTDQIKCFFVRVQVC